MKKVKENFEILENQKRIKRSNAEIKKIQNNCKDKVLNKDTGRIR